MLQPRFSLDRRYTVFGRVVSGMQYVDAIHKGEPPAVMSRMVQVSVAADNKPIPPASMLTETVPAPAVVPTVTVDRSEEHTSELQSLLRLAYALFCLKKKRQPHISHLHP